MKTRDPETKERERLLSLEEDHFADLKSFHIKPSALQETFVSFANSDGGDLYVGIDRGSLLLNQNCGAYQPSFLLGKAKTLITLSCLPSRL
jgi:hypothetical protein